MRAAEMPVPSYRLGRESASGGLAGRMLLIGGGLLVVVVVASAAWWGLSRGASRNVPLIEADPRPFRVRPDDPGGLRVQNQNELIFDRDRRSQTQAPASARLAPEAEAPRLESLRQQVAPPPAPPAPRAAAPQAPAAPAQTAAATAPPPAQTGGRFLVQLGALATEEAARAEFDRAARRAPELFANRRPVVARFDREGQPTLWRVRTSGFADRAAAAQFCEQLRTRGGACTLVAN